MVAYSKSDIKEQYVDTRSAQSYFRLQWKKNYFRPHSLDPCFYNSISMPILKYICTYYIYYLSYYLHLHLVSLNAPNGIRFSFQAIQTPIKQNEYATNSCYPKSKWRAERFCSNLTGRPTKYIRCISQKYMYCKGNYYHLLRTNLKVNPWMTAIPETPSFPSYTHQTITFH